MSGKSSTVPITMGYDQTHQDWLDSKKLCEQCQYFFDHWGSRDTWDSDRPDHRHHNLRDLQESAQNCPICELWMVAFLDSDFISQSGHEISSEVDPLERGLVTILHLKSNDMFRCTLKFPGATLTSPTLESAIDLYDNWEFKNDESTTIGEVSEYTDCETSWELARRWLKSCTESHACHERIALLTERQLPSRLIDVGKGEGQARLCLSKDFPADVQYLTLSHCWGEKRITTLLHENLDTFRSGIPQSALSKSFKDAMKATRELGFTYIWIDSLCIVQDDNEDWNEQAPLMISIYSNSVLNLSAIDSSDGDGGLFFRREFRKVYCWKLNLGDEQGPVGPQTLKWWICCSQDFEHKHWAENFLARRAWVSQERCLAPRVLSFGHKELLWECREHRASETLPKGFKSGAMTYPGLLAELRDSAQTVHSVLKCWNSIVVDYSKGKLTRWSDKLVAISGIARLLAQKWDMHYLAGLWRENLLRQLVWYTLLEVETPTVQYQAPSWSWAAINSEVFYHRSLVAGGSNYVDLAVVEEAYVTSMGNPFNEVSGGSLTLRCPYFGSASISLCRSKFRSEWALAHIKMSWVYPDHRPHRFHGKIFYLPFLYWEEEDEFCPENLHGLVLKLNALETYIRVGCFSVMGWENIELFLTKLCERPVTIQELKREDLLSNEEGDGKKGKMITIV